MELFEALEQQREVLRKPWPEIIGTELSDVVQESAQANRELSISWSKQIGKMKMRNLLSLETPSADGKHRKDGIRQV